MASIRECSKTLQEMEKRFSSKFFPDKPESKFWDLYTKMDQTFNKWSASLGKQTEVINEMKDALGYRTMEASLISQKLEGVVEN